MGLALSRELVTQGWKVAMADIQPNEVLSNELGDSALFFKTNVADYDSQAATFQKTWDKFGRIDALCANAGIVDRRSDQSSNASTTLDIDTKIARYLYLAIEVRTSQLMLRQ